MRLFILLGAVACFLGCKLAAPESFVDKIPGSIALTNLNSVASGYAGVLAETKVKGTLTGGGANLRISFDDGAYDSVTLSGTAWYIALPSGSSWIDGSVHQLRSRICDAIGNCNRTGIDITFTYSVAASCTFANLRNVNSGYAGELFSGVLIGSLTNGGASAQVAFDGGVYKDVTVVGNIWKIFIPVGATAAAGLKRWQVGSQHTLSIKAADSAGTYGKLKIVTFTRQLNKDVNGDGYADVVVGAPENDGTSAAGGQIAGATRKGAAYVFYGSASGTTLHPENATAYYCSGPPDCTVIQNPDNKINAVFPRSVSFAGDVNGDGYADVVVGATGNDGSSAAGGQTAGVSGKGAAYVFYGSASGVTLHPENATAYYCGGAPDCTVIRNPDNVNNGSFGGSVSFAGDVNGDGYADVIVGAERNYGFSAAGGQTAGAADKGAAYIFYGSASGVTLHPENATAYYCSGAPDCTVIQNPDNVGNGLAGNFGRSVSFAGDVNGDGYADVVVGAQANEGSSAAGGQTAGAADKGAAYVFYGSASGVTLHPENATAYYCSGAPDCTVLQNPDNFSPGAFGYSVSFAGDMNGDGYADVVVGAQDNDGTSAAGGQTAGIAGKGAAYVFYGSTSGVTLHPENATAYYCSGAPDCTVIRNPDNVNNGNFGRAVSFAGDVNGDGYADVVAGAQNYGNSAAGGQTAGAGYKGAMYIFYGSANGVTLHPESAPAYYCSGAPDCTVIQNPDNKSNGGFGRSVSSAGDVNGDGYADVVVGAYSNDGTSAAGGQTAGAASKGATYVFYGSASGVTLHPENATAYYCSGSTDCTVLQNPDNVAPAGFGSFGYSVGILAPALRSVPVRLDSKLPSPSGEGLGVRWREQCARREEEMA